MEIRTYTPPDQQVARLPISTYRRRRAAVGLAVLTTLGSVGVGVAAIAFDSKKPCTTHTVKDGDTRWGIASAAHPNMDPRYAVQKLNNDNGITSGHTIQPGDRLKVC